MNKGLGECFFSISVTESPGSKVESFEIMKYKLGVFENLYTDTLGLVQQYLNALGKMFSKELAICDSEQEQIRHVRNAPKSHEILLTARNA